MSSRPSNVSLAGGATIAHEDPALVDGLYALAAANPTRRFVFTSGDRSKQPAHPTFGIAAPEGSSNHELYAYGRAPYDEAIDVTVDGSPIAAVISAVELAAHGLWNGVGGDPVHTALVGVHG